MNGPRILDLPLWKRHEQRVLEVLRSALTRLCESGIANNGELDLNRELYFCMIDVNEENRDSGGDCLDGSPVLDAPNQPTPDTEGSASERKKPDLQWSYMDQQELDPRRRRRSFVIECKLLGSPSESGRKYNDQYVSDGIIRFVHPDWRYGMDVDTGAMVGYIRSLEPQQILAEINSALASNSIALLTPRSSAATSLIELEHSLNRSFGFSPFRLVHLWIDMRSNTI